MSKKRNIKKRKDKKSNVSRINDDFKKAYEMQLNGDVELAQSLYEKILKKQPNHSNALNLLGVIHLEIGNYDIAAQLIERAIRTLPGSYIYHNNLGMVYKHKKLYSDAAKEYKRCIQLNSEYAPAYNNFGTVLKETGQLTEAIDQFQKACSLDENLLEAQYNLGTVYADQGYIADSINAYSDVVQKNPQFYKAWSNLLYTLHFSDTVSPATIFSEHRKWSKIVSEQVRLSKTDHKNTPEPERKLRIGYVSPDFCTHSVSFFIENIFGNYDKSQFEIYCYSNTFKTDIVTDTLKSMIDYWRDITSFSDEKVADIIIRDGIDILVDLAGHTRNNRLLLFALKPSPVQATWLGYPDTTGLDLMDYRLTDVIADPMEMPKDLNTEILYRLPGSFLCYKPGTEQQPVTESPLIKNGRITFGSFNNASKISPGTIELWADILKKMPDSDLKLKSRTFSDQGTCKRILDLFADQGISTERISFVEYTKTLDDHFDLYNTIDIALDTFPYHGTTTTCEALWMGVPVITLAGNTHVSRVGVSLLTTIGLSDLVANSIDDYVNKAVLLAKDHVTLTMFRAQLRNMMMASPLMDAKGFTATLEKAFREIWGKWCSTKVNSSPSNTSSIKENVHKTYFDNNVAVLKEKHHDIYSRLDEKVPFDIEVRLSESGTPNLYVNKDTSEFYPCYNENDPLKELPELIEKLKDTKGTAICIMGSGLCIHIPSLVEILGNSNLIILYEAWPGIFKKSMECVDLRKVLSHPNVRLVVGETPDLYDMISDNREKLLSINGMSIIAQKGIMALASEWYEKNRIKLNQFFIRQNANTNTLEIAGEIQFKNRFENLFAMASSTPFDKLRDIYKGVPAVVVAAGPSLSKNIELLKNQNGAIIIAVDSAVAPLLKHGIIPDFVATIDFNAFTYEKLAPYSQKLSDCELIFAAEGTPYISKYINFKNAYYIFKKTSCRDMFSEILGKENQLFSEAHSVIHDAIHSVQIMGCDPVVFMGLDLAYDSNKDHADGTILHWGNQINTQNSNFFVEGVYGARVASSAGFIGMKEACEHMIKEGPDVRYIDATEGGAKIDGTTIKTLNETLKMYCRKKVNKVSVDKSDHISNYVFVLTRLKQQQKEITKLERFFSEYFKSQQVTDAYFKKNPKILSFESIPEKIKKNLRSMDSITIKFNDNCLISCVNNLLAKSLKSYLDHEIGAYKANGLSTEMQELFSSLEQQKFVQKIRFEAFSILKTQIDKQVTLFSDLNKFQKAVDANSDSETDKLRLAQFYYNSELLDKAESMLKIVSGNPETDYYIGCIRVKKGNVKEGLKILNNSVDQNYSMKKEVDGFLERISDEWIHSTGPISYQRILANRVLMIDPEHKEALAKEKRFKNADFLNQAKVFLGRARKCHIEGNVSGAVQILEDNTEIHQSLKADWFELHARCLIETGCLDEGFEKLEEAVGIDTNKAVLWEEIGDVLSNEKSYDVALQMYEKCMMALPDRLDVLIKIGDLYLMSKNIEAAKFAYEMVLSKKPENINAQKKLELINTMM